MRIITIIIGMLTSYSLLALEPPLPHRLQDNQALVVNCSRQASKEYGIPVKVILGIYENEKGKYSSVINNSNNTQDIGYMQLNTRYLKDLSKYGIEAKDLKKKDCYSFFLATYKIKNHILNDKGDFYTKVSNYHSRTPSLNVKYKAKLLLNISKWEARLSNNNINANNLTGKNTNIAKNNKSINVDEMISFLRSRKIY